MIDLYIDTTNEKLILTHNMCCKEHVVDEITKVLDIIIADYEIKTKPSLNKLSEKEKKQLIISKRAEYLNEMMKKDCLCTDFDNNAIYIQQDNVKEETYVLQREREKRRNY